MQFDEDGEVIEPVYAFERGAAREAAFARAREREEHDEDAPPAFAQDGDYDIEAALQSTLSANGLKDELKDELRSLEKGEPAYDIGREHMTPERLNGLYAAYLAGEPNSETPLFKATEGYIYRIVKKYEYADSGFTGMGTAQEADDFAADTLLSMWEAMRDGRINRSYFHYVRSAAYKQRARFLRYLMNHREEIEGLEQSAEPSGNSDFSSKRTRFDDNGEGDGAMATSTAVFNSMIYRSGWEDENGGPVIPNSCDYGPPPALQPKFFIRPYMEFIPWMERGPLLALGDAWEKTKTGQPDFARAKKRIAASYGKPVHWVDNKIATFKRELDERRGIVADRFKAFQTLRDEAVRAQMESRIALQRPGKIAPRAQVETMPARERSRTDAAYALASSAVVYLFHEEKFSGIGMDRFAVYLGKRRRINLYTHWDSELQSLIHLVPVMAESQLHPEVPLESLSTWSASRRKLYDYYAVMYWALIQFMHTSAEAWEYDWTREFRNALPTMAQVNERSTSKVSERVMERPKVREWARKAYRVMDPMNDLESAQAFVTRHWADIEAIALRLLDAPGRGLSYEQCQDIVNGKINPAMELVEETVTV
jgi:hypothetical protein